MIIIKTTNERFLGETPEDQIEKFAYLQVKTIWSILLRKFDCELCQEHPQLDYSALVVGPKSPCMIKFKHKTDFS